MSEFKYTPGPWTVAATDDSLIVVGRQKIASTYEVPGDVWGSSNAHLISAAPELLEACADALDSMESVGVLVTGDMHKGDPAVEKLRAAIAKALGEGQ